MQLTWSIVRSSVLSICFASTALPAFAQTSEKPGDKTDLENRVRSAPDVPLPFVNPQNWQKSADATQKVLTTAASDCEFPKLETFAGKYAITSEIKTGALCKVYDLSFPTLRTLAKTLTFSALPAQRFTARDYLDWLNGNTQTVETRMNRFRGATGTFAVGEEAPETASWVTDLKFRSDADVAFAVMAPGLGRLPKSFRASDLDLGTKFAFNAQDRARLKALFSAMRNAGTPEATVNIWMQFADRPASFLDKIKFDWNDARKVYDIALEGEFLPLGGPIALVDFKVPYKPAVERLVRNILGSALRGLTNLVPHPTVRNVLYIAVDDAFVFIEQLYDYQYNQLEDTLRSGMSSDLKLANDPKAAQKSLNLVYGARSDFMSAYIMALAQGQKFDWTAIEKIGNRSRYATEKTREIRMNETNSRLVLKAKCTMDSLDDYFGVCSKAGQPVAIYSLVSPNPVLFWNLGAPMIYKFNAPAEVSLKRMTSYLLSVGIRLFDLPVRKSIVKKLGYALKDFATAGVVDEAFLRNSLWMEKQNKGALDTKSQELMFVLYRQNMNPFIPKSEASEAKIIQYNSEQLQQGVAP